MRLALIDADDGRYAQALAEAAKSRDPWVTAYVHARAQRRPEALAVVERMKSTGSDPEDLAVVYTALGRSDDAFVWLENAYQQHRGMIDLRADIWWDPLRNDPRFLDLIRRVGIPGS
jgi:hypothetical protein